MFNDPTQLHSVSIWMTRDNVSFVFLVEFKELKKLLDIEKDKSVNSVVQKVVGTAEQLMEDRSWTAYLIQCVYAKQYICHSNLKNMQSLLTKARGDEIEKEAIIAQKLLFSRLTTREQEILILLAGDYSLNQVCSQLNIKLSTLKYHRNNIFEKMQFITRLDLVFWFHKYNSCLNL